MNRYQDISLPNKDTDINQNNNIPIEKYIEEARGILNNANNDLDKQVDAIYNIANKLVSYNDPFKMMLYVDKLAKEFKIKKGDFNLAIKEAREAIKEDKNNIEESPLISRVESFIRKKYQIYFNVVANKFMYRKNDENEFVEMNEHNIYRDLQKAHIRFPMSDLKSLLKSDFVKKKNPFSEYFENLTPWDGTDHIENCSSYILVREISRHGKEKDRFQRMFKKMLVRSVACSLEKDSNKQCFTIVGEKQNTGKTTFLRWLCPPKLEDYYTENVGTTKDDLIALTENFIVNQDELSTLSKYEINALKSVMSKQRVKVRLPYGERPELLQRRCNFVASTNRLEFLNDETGSVRWVCFLLDNIKWEYETEIDIDKIWAQAYYLFKNSDFDYQLTPAEIEENERANQAFLIRSPEMELIQKYMLPATKGEFDNQNGSVEILFMSASDILRDLNQKSLSTIKLNIINIGKALKILGFKQYSIYESDNGISRKGYFLKYRDAIDTIDDSNKSDIKSFSEPNNNELPF